MEQQEQKPAGKKDDKKRTSKSKRVKQYLSILQDFMATEII
jgi:hypothetical protein